MRYEREHLAKALSVEEIAAIRARVEDDYIHEDYTSAEADAIRVMSAYEVLQAELAQTRADRDHARRAANAQQGNLEDYIADYSNAPDMTLSALRKHVAAQPKASDGWQVGQPVEARHAD